MKENFFEKLFAQFDQLKATVIGDVMLDVYWWGNVERISPEAPVPVVSLKKKETRLGGAANVALNLEALGAKVQMFSVIGEDENGDILLQLFNENKISTHGIIQSKKRVTTSKARIMSRSQQILRLDAEDLHDIAGEEEKKLLQQIKKSFTDNKPDVVIFEDYNKGLLTAYIIEQVISLCNQLDIPTCVDPKLKNFLAYKSVTIFKPNLKELREGLHITPATITKEELGKVHQQLYKKLSHQISLITLSEHGIFYQEKSKSRLIPSHIRNIADVSGAGDTVIATAALVWAITHNAKLMAEIANIAGGLVCEEVGVAAINKKQLRKECQLLLTHYQA
jgi:D-glycero-beta-D-manno-heptose-7-phosphate kinase